MIKQLVQPLTKSIVNPLINAFPGSFWRVDGTLSCDGTLYCLQGLPC